MRFSLILVLTLTLLGMASFARAQESSDNSSMEDASETTSDDLEEAAEDVADDDTSDEGATEVLETSDQPSLLDQYRPEAGLSTPPLVLKKYPWVEWHGYYRFRTDLITEADLGTFASYGGSEYVATSLFLPSQTRNGVNGSGDASFEKVAGEKEKTIGTANMRLRLAPTFHLADTLRVSTTIDVLDNLILGTTPDYLAPYSHPYVPLDTFTTTQIPPSSGINSFYDSFVVKEAYAEWDLAFVERMTAETPTLGTLRMGRFAWGWGLGISTSRGDYDRRDRTLTTRDRFTALDAEWGNYVDRFQWTRDFGAFQLMAGYGWLSSGAYETSNALQAWAPYDLAAQDNIRQLELAIYHRPETSHQFDAHRKQLFSGRPAVSWGLYVNYRFQDSASGTVDETTVSSSSIATLPLQARDAWLVTPDLWLEIDYRPTPESRYFVGIEGLVAVGNVGNIAAADQPTTSLEIFQYAWALESAITLGKFTFGLDAGMASGDDGETMAVYQGTESPWGSDTRFSAFSFNKNYIVDMLLYREVLGTVSNSAYIRPHFSFDLLPAEQYAFGGEIDALYGLSMTPEAYAGDSRNLGLEFEAHLYYEETDRFLATAGFGVLLPFAALDRPEDYLGSGIDSKNAVWAWTLQGNFIFVF